MTFTTEVCCFPPIELPAPGAQADDRIKWTISGRMEGAEDAFQNTQVACPFDATDLTYTPISELNTQVARPFDATDLTYTPISEPEVRRSERALATPSQISINWTRLSRSGLTTEAYSRLFKIATRTEGWRGPGSRALHSASLAGFLNFWSLICEQAIEPEFTLLPNGHLGAEWYKKSHRHLDIEFVDDQLAYFGFFSGATEIEGKANIRMIAQLLTTDSAHPLRWKSR
jgi:hypothetical protein